MMMTRRGYKSARPTQRWHAAREAYIQRLTEREARARAKQLDTKLTLEARMEEATVTGWDRRVLETVIGLGGNAHDEAILRTLRRAGHASLSLNSLLLPLKRLEARGILIRCYVERERRGSTERLRFWASTMETS